MKPIKAGIIGCGNIGGRYDEVSSNGATYTHAGMYTKVDGFDLVSATDSDPERIEAFHKFWNVPNFYTNHLDMLKNETLDIISIATPDDSHNRLIQDVIKYQKPKMIFTEKPFANDMESAIELYLRCQEKGVAVVVDYIRRWDKNHQEIKHFLKKGELGAIQAVTGYYVRGIRHNGCQLINLLQFLIGKIQNVQSMGPSDLGSMENDPSIDLDLTFDNGLRAAMKSVDQAGYGFSIFEIDIFGKKGRLRLVDGSQKAELFQAQPDSRFPNFKRLNRVPSPWENSTYANAMIMAGKQIAMYLQNRTSHLENTALEAVDDLCVIEAGLESARNNNSKISVKRNIV